MIRQQLIDFAYELGFELVGIAKAERPDTFERYQRWIESGAHASMSYLSKNMLARSDPNFILPGVQSVMMLGVSYPTVLESEPQIRKQFENPKSPYLKIASYASGIDYHLWIRKRLKQLSQLYRKTVVSGKCRGIVDTAPFLERHFAQKAGLGHFGKNTMLIHPQYGSRFFLAAFLMTEPFEESEQLRLLLKSHVPAQSHGVPVKSAFGDVYSGMKLTDESLNDGLCSDICGDCQKCCQSCPSGALSPYFLDARKCWNYWTIEHKQNIPNTISEAIGKIFNGPIFGCDICQNVCPWNQPKNQSDEKQPPFGLSLNALESMDAQEFEVRFGQTPLKRTFSAVLGADIFYDVKKVGNRSPGGCVVVLDDTNDRF